MSSDDATTTDQPEGESAPKRLRERDRRTARAKRWPIVVIAGAAAVAAAVGGWCAAPFGQQPSSGDLVPVASAAPRVPLADLEEGVCLSDYESPWSASFVVTDCTEPHTAEQYAVVPVASEFPDGKWPGVEALAKRAMLACQSNEVLNFTIADDVPDLVIESRWPATQAEWDAGERDYHCFGVSPSGELTSALGPRP